MFSPTDGSQSQEDTPSKGHACNGKSGQSAGMSMTPSPAGSSVNIGMTFYNNFGGDSIGMTPMAIDPFSSSDLGQRPKQPKKHELGCEIKIVARGRKDSKADALRKKLADANDQITSTNEIVIAMAQTAQGVYDNATSIIKEARAHSKRQHQQAKQFIKRASTAEARQSKMAMTVSKLSKEMETLKQSLKAEKETVKIKTAMIASNKETLSTLNSTIKTLNGTIKDQEKKIDRQQKTIDSIENKNSGRGGKSFTQTLEERAMLNEQKLEQDMRKKQMDLALKREDEKAKQEMKTARMNSVTSILSGFNGGNGFDGNFANFMKPKSKSPFIDMVDSDKERRKRKKKKKRDRRRSKKHRDRSVSSSSSSSTSSSESSDDSSYESKRRRKGRKSSRCGRSRSRNSRRSLSKSRKDKKSSDYPSGEKMSLKTPRDRYGNAIGYTPSAQCNMITQRENHSESPFAHVAPPDNNEDPPASSFLSCGAINRMYNMNGANPSTFTPTLQVWNLARIGNSGKWKVVLSDGEKFMSGIVGTQLSSLIDDFSITKFDIIKVNQFNVHNHPKKDAEHKEEEVKVFVLLNIDLVKASDDKIGLPLNVNEYGTKPLYQFP